MRGIVLFKGKYGATEQYARWIGEGLNVPVVEEANFSSIVFHEFDYLVIGSSVYMEKLILADWLKENKDAFKNRKLFFFIVCATPSNDKITQDRIITENIPEAILPNCSISFLPGRLDLKTLGFLDKCLVTFAGWFEKDLVKKKVLLNGIDEVRKEHITDLLKEIETFAFSDNLQ